MPDEKRIIEINGVRFEVDMREAKRLDTFAVGSRVKVLKARYLNDWRVHHGVVVGFEPFEKAPTIIIAYVEDNYSDVEVKILYFNSFTTETEIVVSLDDDKLALSKQGVLDTFDKKLRVKENEIDEIKELRSYFLKKFGCYFEEELQEETA